MKTIIMTLFMSTLIVSAYARNLSVSENEIPNAKIAHEVDAKKIAFDAYAKKMNLNILANEGPSDIHIETLGFDVFDFGKKGDKVWEVRISVMAQQLRAILWVHSETAKVYFLVGPWQDKLTKITSAEENKSGVKTNSNAVKP